MSNPMDYVPAEVYLSVLSELTAERVRRGKTPRVFLTDDVVPAGTPVLAPNNYIIPAQRREYRIKTAGIAMRDLPPFGELVAEEKARRAAGGESTCQG